MKLMLSTCIVTLFFVMGCEQAPTSATPTPSAPPPSQQAMQNAMGLSLDPGAGAPVGGSSTPSAPAQTPPVEAPPAVVPTQPPTEQVKAEAGVGLKGQSLQEHSGVLVEPAKAYFRVEQKMVFNVQIPQALSLFQATEGRKPNSQDEFMTKIVAANSIQLPKLAPGQKYVYDVEKGELMVERPAK